MREPSHVYPDPYLAHYADRWRQLCLRYHGITLLQYLAAPAACEAAAAELARCGQRAEPMLMPQRISEHEARRRAADRERELRELAGTNDHRGPEPDPELAALEAAAEAELPGARLAGDRLVEPLHHHSRAHCGHFHDWRRRSR